MTSVVAHYVYVTDCLRSQWSVHYTPVPASPTPQPLDPGLIVQRWQQSCIVAMGHFGVLPLLHTPPPKWRDEFDGGANFERGRVVLPHRESFIELTQRCGE